ncbi:hypothetical protein, partial [Enterobacter hormaechei]|uniref:hypothetical protein n=1 Tax=Enterobacter hormaechei TaxID=158836 RepID=UPI00197AE584
LQDVVKKHTAPSKAQMVNERSPAKLGSLSFTYYAFPVLNRFNKPQPNADTMTLNNSLLQDVVKKHTAPSKAQMVNERSPAKLGSLSFTY